MEALKPVHIRIRGRARYAVSGLKRSEPFKHRLTERLMSLEGITRLSASCLTGCILVIYDPRISAEDITRAIQNAIRHIENRETSETVQRSPPSDHRAESNSRKRGQKIHPLIDPPPASMEAHWHILPGREAIAHFGSDPHQGIAQSSVPDRRREFGENVLPKTECRSGLRIFLGQMNSLPVYLLGAVAGVSIAMGGILDAVIVFGVVLANAGIGYLTESKAEKNIDALNELVHHMAEVIRDGKPLFITAEAVVPGDILVLKPGAFVPADCRILHSSRLTLDESMLTGESLPVEKNARPLRLADTALADMKNMVFMGTFITGGHGVAVAIATGGNTEIGKLKVLLNETGPPRSPIERQLDAIGNQLIYGCLAICGGVFVLGLSMGFGVFNMLRMSISLAAAAVPEGLPSIATINFALGIGRMKKNNVLVRHLPAAETLGAIQTLCLDKTGTITLNRMTATAIFSGEQWFSMDTGCLVSTGGPMSPVDIPEVEALYAACALCCETKINGRSLDGRLDISGSATEKALTDLVDKAGLDVKTLRKRAPLLTVNHRSEEQMFMSTVHKSDTDNYWRVMVKGSPEAVLARCDTHMADGREVLLSPEARLRNEQANNFMAGNALRVLGFARRTVEAHTREDLEIRMTWLGLIGLTDPPRDGIRELIAQFHRAGVKTVMITGDQQISARAIASRIGLSGKEPLEILDAAELARLDDAELIRRAGTVHVYSRVTPSHKLKIVRAIQASGQTVAMTGDGINDGPALKAADIGIAMGVSGTDLARDVADMVLTRDNLELLAASLAEGRCIYQNIRKSVHYSLATNISEIQLMTTALALGMGSPLNVMQLLWINMISDILPGLALSLEKPEVDVMDLQPRNAAEPLFSTRDFGNMFLESSALTGGALATLLYGMSRYGSAARAGGLAFHALAFGQLLHAITCRSETTGLLTRKKLPRNKPFAWALGISIAAQILTLALPPLRSLLGLSAITLMDGLVIGAGAILPLLAGEMTKVLREKSTPEHGQPEAQGARCGHGPGTLSEEEMAVGLKQCCN